MDIYGIEKYVSLEEVIKNNDIIITGIPISKDKEYLVSEYSDLKLELEKFLTKLKNIFLISGMIPKKMEDTLIKNNNNFLDILKDETYLISNAEVTAEGTIKYVIENTDISLFNSNILVIGYGRIGKILCRILKSFTNDIYCISNNLEDFEWMRANVVKQITYEKIDENLKKFNIIINTVPTLVLDKKRLEKVNDMALLIDVASKPGGIDHEFAKEINLKCLWKLGIPGNIAPVTCAQKIKEIIYKNNITYILQ